LFIRILVVIAANVKYKKRRAVKKHFRFGLLLS
jgi:hypothetical protein